MHKIKYTNERIMSIDLNCNYKQGMVILIVAYGPNEDEVVAEKEKFWEDLQREIDDRRKNIIITGDLKGRVGNDNTRVQKWLGTYSTEKIIIEFCKESKIIIANTKFSRKDIHKSNRGEKSIVDYYLVSAKICSIKDVWVKMGEGRKGPPLTANENGYRKKKCTE